MKKMFLLLFSLFNVALFAHQSYTIVPFDTFDFQESDAISLNDHDQVAGLVRFQGKWQPFFWGVEEEFSLIDVVVQPGHLPHVNEKGQVGGMRHEYVWYLLNYYPSPFRWQEGELEKIERPDAKERVKLNISWLDSTACVGIGKEGELLITSVSASLGFSFRLNLMLAEQFYWGAICRNREYERIGSMIALEGAKEDRFYGMKIQKKENNLFCLPLTGEIDSKGYQSVMMYKKGYLSSGNGMEQMIGRTVNEKWEERGLYYDEENGLKDLGTFIPLSINDAGQMVGYDRRKYGNIPCLFENGKKIEVSLLINPEELGGGWESIDALVAINSQGHILARGTIGGESHACLLIPQE